MAVLARATADELALAIDGRLPAFTRLRGPEVGLIMLRGRAGGTGAPFNLGEATVARCTVRTAAGWVGHAYCLGRDLRQAELAAALDAALQDPAHTLELDAAIIQPLAAQQAARRETLARQAAATQVQFFTLATMRS
jgi:alpha-D-ribose 1-methylphosphonate 5-triphosphate synthase subunit PhnG